MGPWRLRLHHRIVIPFVLVALLTTAAAAAAVWWVVSRTFESRVEAQIVNTAEVVSLGGFAVNASVLRSVKAISGAEVVTFTRDGAVLATTIEPANNHLLAVVIGSEAALAAFGAGTPAVMRDTTCDSPCYIAYRRVSDRADTVVAVVAETSEVAAAASVITRTILLAALASLVAVILVSQVVARRVTAPLERLVVFAHDAGGRSPGRAAEGGDEVGRLGRAFNEMQDRLEQSQHALVRSEKLALAGLLAARVAHDIRNPLSSIKMQTQLLQARLHGNDHAQTLITAVLHDVGQVESVIRDLIELARPGELHLAPAHLNDVVEAVLRQLEARLAHRKIAVDAVLAETLPALALDVERFTQALLNVIINAADAMPDGGHLRVATHASGSTVILDVCDDGIGIDSALRARVFDPFVSSKPGGVGLGLVNVKAVVDRHGGTITLEPRTPNGTRARITLPVAAES